MKKIETSALIGLGALGSAAASAVEVPGGGLFAEAKGLIPGKERPYDSLVRIHRRDDLTVLMIIRPQLIIKLALWPARPVYHFNIHDFTDSPDSINDILAFLKHTLTPASPGRVNTP